MRGLINHACLSNTLLRLQTKGNCISDASPCELSEIALIIIIYKLYICNNKLLKKTHTLSQTTKKRNLASHKSYRTIVGNREEKCLGKL